MKPGSANPVVVGILFVSAISLLTLGALALSGALSFIDDPSTGRIVGFTLLAAGAGDVVLGIWFATRDHHEH